MGHSTKELQQKVETVAWKILEPQAGQGLFVLVSRSLDLAEVALHVINDDSEKIEAWLQQGSLTKPAMEQLEAWRQTPDKLFDTIITHPYVLIQEAYTH